MRFHKYDLADLEVCQKIFQNELKNRKESYDNFGDRAALMSLDLVKIELKQINYEIKFFEEVNEHIKMLIKNSKIKEVKYEN